MFSNTSLFKLVGLFNKLFGYRKKLGKLQYVPRNVNENISEFKSELGFSPEGQFPTFLGPRPGTSL